MYRTIADFLTDWTEESSGTQKILDALSDRSLSQKVTQEGRTLAHLAWHLTLTVGEMMRDAGLPISPLDEKAPVPEKAGEIQEAYRRDAAALSTHLPSKWTDAMLEDEISMYGQTWKRHQVLSALIMHQAHHRGQMTVVMRQAGLRVPGIYGPSKEEWGAYNMPAPW